MKRAPSASLHNTWFHEASTQGTLIIHPKIRSPHLKYPRSVIVYLPPGYELNPATRYPVVYMQDGNNLFDPSTAFLGRHWGADEVVDQLVTQNQLRPVIMVGIYNTPHRMDEYSWYSFRHQGLTEGGHGKAYAQFIVKELKPFIDQHYRTRPERIHTAILGSSMGGLISFYTARKYPDVFGHIGMMSPTLYWDNHHIMEDLHDFPLNFRLWVDIGTEEGRDPQTEETVESTQAFAMALQSKGYCIRENLGYYIDWWAGHDEFAWGKRLHLPLRFFFGGPEIGT